MRILLAIRVFFLTLFRGETAAQVRLLLEGQTAATPQLAAETPKPAAKEPPKPKPPVRSDALTLLATLQREARFVDFLQEQLDGYSDAQIGAVARDVHRDCGKVVARLFSVAPVVDGDEGSPVEVPAGFDAGRFRLIGNVTGEPPFAGQLVHHGWEAGRCELPAFTGTAAAARIIAPAEVELK